MTIAERDVRPSSHIPDPAAHEARICAHTTRIAASGFVKYQQPRHQERWDDAAARLADAWESFVPTKAHHQAMAVETIDGLRPYIRCNSGKDAARLCGCSHTTIAGAIRKQFRAGGRLWGIVGKPAAKRICSSGKKHGGQGVGIELHTVDGFEPYLRAGTMLVMSKLIDASISSVHMGIKTGRLCNGRRLAIIKDHRKSEVA